MTPEQEWAGLVEFAKTPRMDANKTGAAILAADADLKQLRADKAELLGALKMLLSYTLTCEGMLNAKPAGQIDIARAAIASAEGAT